MIYLQTYYISRSAMNLIISVWTCDLNLRHPTLYMIYPLGLDDDDHVLYVYIRVVRCIMQK